MVRYTKIIVCIFVLYNSSIQGMDKGIELFNHKNTEEQIFFGKPLKSLSSSFDIQPDLIKNLIKKLINTCRDIHSLSFEENKDAIRDHFLKIKTILDVAAIEKEHLHAFCFSVQYKITSHSIASYSIDITPFHVLVLSSTNALKEKQETIEVFCRRFKEEGYKLFYIKDGGGTQLIHRMFEKGDKAAIAAALNIAQSCYSKIIKKSLHDSNMTTEKPLLPYFLTHRSESSQDTPLHKAAYFNNVAAAQELLTSISKELATFLVNQFNGENHTPIDIAKEKMNENSSFHELYELLLSYKTV